MSRSHKSLHNFSANHVSPEKRESCAEKQAVSVL
ncbi:hypothetical protein T4E_2501 [Trichinella pseudospiralis]|uniref:Uncharacterized protein n=1 Tax=Trichinella pseudospiralis TaxID=6337 RepID=A0A0V0XDA3_TRIPS|nr:hypothetical protein T4E_2501 [Trichinella pseudospiralis]